MGCCLCTESPKEKEAGGEESTQAGTARGPRPQMNANLSALLLNPATSVKKKISDNPSVASSSKGVGMGISMMMYQAGMLAGYGPPPNVIDLNNLRAQMRKAKAEGRTVSVLNGCVYIDYQLKAQIPPGFNYDI